MKTGGHALSVKKCYLLVKGECAAQEILKPKYFRGISTLNPKGTLSVGATRELRIASAVIIRFLDVGNARVYLSSVPAVTCGNVVYRTRRMELRGGKPVLIVY